MPWLVAAPGGDRGERLISAASADKLGFFLGRLLIYLYFRAIVYSG